MPQSLIPPNIKGHLTRLQSSLRRLLLVVHAFVVQTRWTIVETILIAIPLIIICVVAAIKLSSDTGLLSTVSTKPEWYFIALVYCLEALRERTRLGELNGSPKYASGVQFAIVCTIVAAILAVIATLDSLGVFAAKVAAATATLPSTTEPKAINQLHIIAIPCFLLAAFWSGITKIAVKRAEYAWHADFEAMTSIRRPRLFRYSDSKKVAKFYDLIAAIYDRRNEGAKELRRAQRRIVTEIRSLLRADDPGKMVSVLDIGGGTGTNVYSALLEEPHVKWTYIDSSTVMAAKFQEDYESAAGGAPTILVGDALSIETALDVSAYKEHFDFAILSFSLSSMPANPEFRKLAAMLKPGARVLIADIHPGYVAKSPFFDVPSDGDVLHLELRKVESLLIERDANGAGLVRDSWDVYLNRRGEAYCYFVAFTKPAP